MWSASVRFLEGAGIDYKDGNFEALYSSLVTDGSTRLSDGDGTAIAQYFSAMEVAPMSYAIRSPYLSVRPKDIIATFNWDRC